jgi:hypothetical protein
MNDFDVVTGQAPDLASVRLTPQPRESRPAHTERGSGPSLPSPSTGAGQPSLEGPSAD